MEDEQTGPVPRCCGRDMTVIRSGRRANFAIWIWRCPTCEQFESTNRRYDGRWFWVGAMGNAIQATIDGLIADAYAEEPPRT